jgi:hypothetical protein
MELGFMFRISHLIFAFGVSALVVCAGGCGYLNPYNQIKPDMLKNPNGKLCWAPSNSPLTIPRDRCANEKAQPSLDRCVAKLERAWHWYTPVEDVDSNVIRCMQIEGWERAVYEGFIVILG